MQRGRPHLDRTKDDAAFFTRPLLRSAYVHPWEGDARSANALTHVRQDEAVPTGRVEVREKREASASMASSQLEDRTDLLRRCELSEQSGDARFLSLTSKARGMSQLYDEDENERK